MCYKLEVTDPELRAYYKLEHMWVISSSVGWGNLNTWADVMGVQYLINKCAGKKMLETDGVFGQKTFKAIKKFQDSINKAAAGYCRVDGRVSNKTYNERVLTTNGENYTIDMLNSIFFAEKRIYFDDPRRDPDFPVDLYYACA